MLQKLFLSLQNLSRSTRHVFIPFATLQTRIKKNKTLLVKCRPWSKPYTAAILTSLRKRFSCSTFYAHQATFQAYLFYSFVSFIFFYYFRWSYGIVMWEIATLGNIPTSTYFVARVAFSLGRDGGHREVRFCPILLALLFVALPNNQNRSVPSGYLGSIRLNKCIIKQENGQYSVFIRNFIP